MLDKCIHYSDIGKNEPFGKGSLPVSKGNIEILSPHFKFEITLAKLPTLRLWDDLEIKDEKKKSKKDWTFFFENLKLLEDIINVIKSIQN